MLLYPALCLAAAGGGLAGLVQEGFRSFQIGHPESFGKLRADGRQHLSCVVMATLSHPLPNLPPGPPPDRPPGFWTVSRSDLERFSKY